MYCPECGSKDLRYLIGAGVIYGDSQTNIYCVNCDKKFHIVTRTKYHGFEKGRDPFWPRELLLLKRARETGDMKYLKLWSEAAVKEYESIMRSPSPPVMRQIKELLGEMHNKTLAGHYCGTMGRKIEEISHYWCQLMDLVQSSSKTKHQEGETPDSPLSDENREILLNQINLLRDDIKNAVALRAKWTVSKPSLRPISPIYLHGPRGWTGQNHTRYTFQIDVLSSESEGEE